MLEVSGMTPTDPTVCWECGAPATSPGPSLLVLEGGLLERVPTHHCEACASTWPHRVVVRQALIRAFRRLGYAPRTSELIDDDWDATCRRAA